MGGGIHSGGNLELVVRSPAPLSQVRSKATDSEMLQRYFDFL